jgi:hypothetical protein
MPGDSFKEFVHTRYLARFLSMIDTQKLHLACLN